MLSIFRSNQLMISLLLIFYAAALHASVFILPESWSPSAYGVFSGWIYEVVGTSGFLPDALAVGLLFVQAFFINVVATSNRLANEVNLFPGLFYLLAASLLPEFLHLSPHHIANTFLIIALAELMKTYKTPSCADTIFNVGFWIGVGSLFHFSYLTFILMGVIGLGVMRAFKFRERLMLLIGALTPYLLTAVYFFWHGRLGEFFQKQFAENFSVLDIHIQPSWDLYIKAGFFGLILLIVLFSYNQYVFKKNIQVQKKVAIFFWAVFSGVLTIFLQAGIQLDQLLVLVVPVGVLLSFNFTDLDRQWAEILHFLLFLVVLLLQYKELIL